MCLVCLLVSCDLVILKQSPIFILVQRSFFGIVPYNECHGIVFIFKKVLNKILSNLKMYLHVRVIR
ncbi:hypothetical protein CH381_10600 [Leptospira sp. mixed culture ATI2-C-A1]|nr:hypothetical protein CH381_10600 [Leptospira sp. mixed culture ATI2-C-A1]